MSTAIAVQPNTSVERDEDFAAGLEVMPALESVDNVSPTGERAAIRDSFHELADELEDAAAGLSSTRRAARYPAFVEILALGDSVIPEVIERLKTSGNRPLWLRVLGTLTPFPPGAGESTIDDAADAWIRWGRRLP